MTNQVITYFTGNKFLINKYINKTEIIKEKVITEPDKAE